MRKSISISMLLAMLTTGASLAPTGIAEAAGAKSHRGATQSRAITTPRHQTQVQTRPRIRARDINVLVRSANGSRRVPYSRLTRLQKDRINRVVRLLELPRGKRPPPSERIRRHPMYASAENTRRTSQAPILDCEYNSEWGALCWIGDDLLCGIVWGEFAGGGIDIGCFD